MGVHLLKNHPIMEDYKLWDPELDYYNIVCLTRDESLTL
jgi:hypothetical protein